MSLASRPFADGRHYTASEQIDDGKHQRSAGRLDHSPMGGISQRQSESMTGSISRHQMVGSIDLLSAFHSAFAGSISQRLREKHFSSLRSGKHQQNCWHFAALAREAFLITESWEASTVLLAFRSAFAGSISHRQGGREASAYAGISQRFRRKHFTSSLWTGSISQRRGREASA